MAFVREDEVLDITTMLFDCLDYGVSLFFGNNLIKGPLFDLRNSLRQVYLSKNQYT